MLPLPRISACLDALGGANYFSTLDLRSGFWQTALDPRDADKTAFITRRGQFRFKVLSFGLANAPSLFQRIMDLVLAGLSWECCLVYVDDIIVFAKTLEEHVVRLTQVFERLQNAGLKLKPDKVKLFQRRVGFLGCIVSGEGIEPDPEKVRAVVDWPVPRSVGEVRSFIGLCSYYRGFIKDLSVVAAPLFDLTRKDAAFKWTAECQGAFNLLKERLVTAPVLAPPLDGGGYVLDVDACDFGIGGVLQQQQGDCLRVIGYCSRTLTPAERAYCTTRKEQLAVVYGLKQFRSYILGHETVVRSDHAALSYLKRAKEPVGQQARWLDFIEQFSLEICYRRGASHGNADSLSRRPCQMQGNPCRQCCGRRAPDETVDDRTYGRAVITRRQARLGPPAGEETTSEWLLSNGCPEPVLEPVGPVGPVGPVEPLVSAESPAPAAPAEVAASDLSDVDGEWTAEWLSAKQRADPALSLVYRWLLAGGDCPDSDEVRPCSPEVKTYVTQWGSLCLKEGVIYRKFERPEGGVLFYQLLTPRALRGSCYSRYTPMPLVILLKRKLLNRCNAERIGIPGAATQIASAKIANAVTSSTGASSRGRRVYKT